MNDETRFEVERSPMGPLPVLSRRHRLAMVVGVAGILAAMTTALATAAVAPRPAGAATACVQVRR